MGKLRRVLREERAAISQHLVYCLPYSSIHSEGRRKGLRIDCVRDKMKGEGGRDNTRMTLASTLGERVRE